VLGQRAQIHDFPFCAENVGEAALVRHALHDWQLTTFKATTYAGT
jgi:hypothetical protein